MRAPYACSALEPACQRVAVRLLLLLALRRGLLSRWRGCLTRKWSPLRQVWRLVSLLRPVPLQFSGDDQECANTLEIANFYSNYVRERKTIMHQTLRSCRIPVLLQKAFRSCHVPNALPSHQSLTHIICKPALLYYGQHRNELATIGISHC